MRYVVLSLLVCTAACSVSLYGNFLGCNYNYQHWYTLPNAGAPCSDRLYAKLLAQQSTITCTDPSGEKNQVFVVAANNTLSVLTTLPRDCRTTVFQCPGFTLGNYWALNFSHALDNTDKLKQYQLTEDLACKAL